MPTTSMASSLALSRMSSLTKDTQLNRLTKAFSANAASKKHEVSSTIHLGNDIHLFSLPLLETAAIQINPFNKNPPPPPARIFSRVYPQNSLMDNVDIKQWRRFWIKEGVQPHGSEQSPSAIQMIRIFDNEKRCLRLQIVIESKPGQLLSLK